MSANLIRVVSEKAAGAVGPYSQAIRCGPFIHTSGQIGMNRSLELVSEDVTQQTRQALFNLQEVLKSAGCSLNDVVKCTVFIKDMEDFQKVNDVYAAVFADHKPARSCVEVSRLPKDAKFEIEAIAYKD